MSEKQSAEIPEDLFNLYRRAKNSDDTYSGFTVYASTIIAMVERIAALDAIRKDLMKAVKQEQIEAERRILSQAIQILSVDDIQKLTAMMLELRETELLARARKFDKE